MTPSACIFCKIAAGEIPAKKVHEDEDIVAFRDLNPQAPTHVLIIPRRHVASLASSWPRPIRTHAFPGEGCACWRMRASR